MKDNEMFFISSWSMGLYHGFAQKTLPLWGPVTEMHVSMQCVFFATFTQNQPELTSFSQNPKYVIICLVGVVLFRLDKWPDGQMT
jgi:hypothetical protein